jgi:uncharacterized protein YndB with AHSA1/START domain
MEKNNQTKFVKDLPNKKITVEREFNAVPEDVWRAWTESKLLDQWWAPHPWRVVTKSMDFREGGSWLYSMVGPNNERHWSKADYIKINKPKDFEMAQYFADENGVKNAANTSGNWKNEFIKTATGTKVIVTITFPSEEVIATFIEIGFEAGFTAALGNLEQYFDAKSK